jgi:hypothetical protein
MRVLTADVRVRVPEVPRVVACVSNVHGAVAEVQTTHDAEGQ